MTRSLAVRNAQQSPSLINPGVQKALSLPSHVAVHVMDALITPMDVEWPPNLAPEQQAMRNIVWSEEFAQYTVEVLAAASRKLRRRESSYPPKIGEVLAVVEEVFEYSPQGLAKKQIAAFHRNFLPYPQGRSCYDFDNIPEEEWRVAIDRVIAERLKPEQRAARPYWLYEMLVSCGVRTTSPNCPMPLQLRREYGLPCSPEEIEDVAPDGLKPSQIAEQERRREENRRKAEVRKRAEAEMRSGKVDKVIAPYLFLTREEWRRAMQRAVEVGSWQYTHGPLPNEQGTFVAPDVLVEFGFEPHEATVAYWQARDAAGEAFKNDPRFVDRPDRIDCRAVLKRLQNAAEPAEKRTAFFIGEQAQKFVDGLCANQT